MQDKTLWKGTTLMTPVPAALVTCGDMENPNALTIAWTGIINTKPPKTYISVQPIRYSYDIIKNSGEFIINMPSKKMARAVDYCGVRSGRNENKLEKCKLTPYKVEGFECPAIKESPISLLCKVFDTVDLGSHTMFLADITGVIVDNKLIDDTGRFMIENADIIAYCHGKYFELGKEIGKFGYSVEKKKKR